MKSRCTSKAAKYILARCRPGAANLYNSIKNLTDYLTLIYQNVNREEEARIKFRGLF